MRGQDKIEYKIVSHVGGDPERYIKTHADGKRELVEVSDYSANGLKLVTYSSGKSKLEFLDNSFELFMG